MSAKILLRKTSLVDYPGRVSAVFFFRGCNLRCPWCYNGGLVTAEAENTISPQDGVFHLEKRRFVLGGVVLSGGEPCLWDGLPGLIEEIKNIPLPVKLDTNGMNPAMLEELFRRKESRPDYIALDLKTAPRRYARLAAARGGTAEAAQSPARKLIESAALLRGSGIAHEYRSLALPAGFVTERDVEELAPLADGAPWYFRAFRGGGCLDPAWDALEESAGDAYARAESLAQKARALGKNGINAVTPARYCRKPADHISS